jgi:chitin synthase
VSHPYKDFLDSNNPSEGQGQRLDMGSGSAYGSFDPEAGAFRRKRSLVRRDRARPTSFQASLSRNGSKYKKNTSSNTNSARLSYYDNNNNNDNDNDLYNYKDEYDIGDGIQLQNLSSNNDNNNNNQRNSTFNHSSSYNDQFSIVSETREINPFGQENQNNETFINNHSQPREINHLNDENFENFDENNNNINLKNNFNENSALVDNEFYTAIPPKRMDLEEDKNGFPYWKLYCYIITFWAPGPILKLFGLKTRDRQYAWREKIGLISIILVIGTIIGFLTFGFTRAACTNLTVKLKPEDLLSSYLVINGRAYDLSTSLHPAAPGIEANTNILYPPINAGGKDASLLFQNVNGNCKGLIKPRENSSIPFSNDEMAWYMPCKIIELDGSTNPNFTFEYYNGYACHTSKDARTQFYSLKVQGDLYYSWENITDSTRNLIVYNGQVIDMGFLDWLSIDDLTYPTLFDEIKNDKTMRGYDISLLLTEPHERQIANCLVEIAKVGVVDSSTIGCIASKIVLYVSLVFVLSIVIIQFLIACYFKWFIAPYQGISYSSIKEMNDRNNQIENWVDDPYNSAPISDVPIKRRANYHSKKAKKSLRLSWGGDIDDFINDENINDNNSSNYKPKYITMTTEAYMMANENKRKSRSMSRSSMFSTDNLTLNPFKTNTDPFQDETLETLDTSLICSDVIPQPPVNWEPFGYPLIHTMCLVTCYSEDEDGIRTTIDSIATTDYPNSHKLIVIICDGLITGAGNDRSTPDICLDMMTDLVVPKEEVQPYSYVSVAEGSKRHNMAKVYSGFYKYNDMTVPPEKQQKTPVLLIVKCGTTEELTSAKPGNRGKRDSQIILMSFLQAVTFNERMTPLQYEMMKSIWQVTGLMSTMYESILMVDADTLIYPDSLTHMVAELVKDPEIMGLCGETKISNKAQSWVTAIQVFEYYISHHQSKAFESVFGSVTCLPGCFCMYRIKSPKSTNVWVPILANSDIVEKYSDNVLNSLHKKNLLLLGEDRYLTSLMLRAFPRRKQVFVPKAACKTVVPDTFKVLLSQRRRWINSTVHNLMELALVKDLCGAFCLSMQFIIIVQLIGTLVLPASITFTLYIIFIAIFSTPTPTLSLILMGIIFGLPAVLIIVTVSNLTYIIWMFIYIFSLPIWNFVLPTYAYWKFDDFSWGDTRKTAGGDKGSHADGDGEFDGSQIKQRTWREFELQRKEDNIYQRSDSNNIDNDQILSHSNIASVYNPGNHDYDNDEPEYVDMSHNYNLNF